MPAEQTRERGYIDRQAIISKYKGICWVCGDIASAEVDHVIPFASGGSDHESNLRPIHGGCNKRRNRIRNADKYAAIYAPTYSDFVLRKETNYLGIPLVEEMWWFDDDDEDREPMSWTWLKDVSFRKFSPPAPMHLDVTKPLGGLVETREEEAQVLWLRDLELLSKGQYPYEGTPRRVALEEQLHAYRSGEGCYVPEKYRR